MEYQKKTETGDKIELSVSFSGDEKYNEELSLDVVKITKIIYQGLSEQQIIECIKQIENSTK